MFLTFAFLWQQFIAIYIIDIYIIESCMIRDVSTSNRKILFEVNLKLDEPDGLQQQSYE